MSDFAPIFMLPLAGMLFLLGAVVHQFAGLVFGDAKEYGLWVVVTLFGIALQICAVVILITA